MLLFREYFTEDFFDLLLERLLLLFLGLKGDCGLILDLQIMGDCSSFCVLNENISFSLIESYNAAESFFLNDFSLMYGTYEFLIEPSLENGVF